MSFDLSMEEMVKQSFFILGTIALASCSKQQNTDVVTKNYYHKYGFEVAESEWEMRHKNGKVVSMLDNGITLTETYENGVLTGITTTSFPDSKIIQKKFVYDDGALLKEILYDTKGLPIWEKDYEFEGHILKTTWNAAGTPLSIEEFKNDKLVDAKYYNSDHEEAATVSNGFGTKIKRSRTGELLHKEVIEDGIMTRRTSYHPNGTIRSESIYRDLQLDGPQKTFSPKKDLISVVDWKDGVLHGKKILYYKGMKSQEISFTEGKRHGLEIHYHKGNPKAEIHWKNGVKHGSSKFYDDQHSSIKWYFNDKEVSRNEYEGLEQKERILSEFKNLF